MLVAASKPASHAEAAKRLKAWTRERFSLDETATVMSAQLRCATPGCPPVETVVAFWTGDSTRYRFKVFKPIADIVYDDLPYGWLLPALADDDGIGLDCC